MFVLESMRQDNSHVTRRRAGPAAASAAGNCLAPDTDASFSATYMQQIPSTPTLLLHASLATETVWCRDQTGAPISVPKGRATLVPAPPVR